VDSGHRLVRHAWPALSAARARDPSARLPFLVQDRRVGSVARQHLLALQPWRHCLRIDDDGVRLQACGDAATKDLARINAALRAAGLVQGWRDELCTLFDPATMQALAQMERAAMRFWGTLTLGAHATGFVASGDGRPAQLWVATRAADKATDPGLFDNLVGGGVPAGQTPLQTLQREAWEEAGLPWPSPALLRLQAAPHALRLLRDVPEGLQHELLLSWDLQLLPDWQPANQDGEVAAVRLLGAADALALAASTRMTVDASLVTLDFALRHGLLQDAVLAAGIAELRAPAFAGTAQGHQSP